jgi:zeaxanthin glucosyltransferase
MSHFGVLCFKGMGHLNPLIALSRQLISRGHRVTLFQEAELEDLVRSQGLEFYPITTVCKSASNSQLNTLNNSRAKILPVSQAIQRIVCDMEMSLREMPDALTHAKIDVLVMDEIILAGPTVAQILNLPYFVISTSVPHRFGWKVSPRTSGDKYPLYRASPNDNSLLQVSAFRTRGPIARKLDAYRKSMRLGPIARIIKDFPPLAHITQLPQCLDLPRSGLPEDFYYAGPFMDQSARPSVEFPWSRLDDRPMVYACMGTVGKEQPSVLRMIAEACHDINLQLVVSLGGRSYSNKLESLAGGALVVKDAPQLELLKKAALVITHGGLNTALETLMEGKPMIAIPIAYDQPAVAARLARQKVAVVLPVARLSCTQIRMAIIKVLGDPEYRDAALKLQANICSTRGLEMAADLIEAGVKSRKELSPAKSITIQ